MCFATLKNLVNGLMVYLARSGVLPKWRGNGLQKNYLNKKKFAKKLGYNGK